MVERNTLRGVAIGISIVCILILVGFFVVGLIALAPKESSPASGHVTRTVVPGEHEATYVTCPDGTVIDSAGRFELNKCPVYFDIYSSSCKQGFGLKGCVGDCNIQVINKGYGTGSAALTLYLKDKATSKRLAETLTFNSVLGNGGVASATVTFDTECGHQYDIDWKFNSQTQT